MIAFSGRPQLVGHVRQELRLVLAGLRKLAVGLLELLEQPGVLDGDDGLVRERLQQRDLAVRERPDLGPDQAEARRSTRRSGRSGTRAAIGAPKSARRDDRARADTPARSARPAMRDAARRATPDRRWHRADALEPCSRRGSALSDRQVARHVADACASTSIAVTIWLIRCLLLGAAQSGGAARRACRAPRSRSVGERRDDTQHLGRSGLLLEGLASARRLRCCSSCEQAGVLDGDDGLIGERLEQRDLAGGCTVVRSRSERRAHRWPRLRGRAESCEPTPSVTEPIGSASPGNSCAVAGSDRRRVDRCAVRGCSSGSIAGAERGSLLRRRISDTFVRRQRRPEISRLPDVERRRRRLSLRRRARLDDGVEDRLGIGRRGGDDPQHLGRGGLLLQRLAQLAVALLQLLEEAGVLDGDDRPGRRTSPGAQSARSENGLTHACEMTERTDDLPSCTSSGTSVRPLAGGTAGGLRRHG